ncbi:dipeptide ABC transporter ATP-binding protein DppD [Nocardioides gansuensis]|uniref:Dipeptide ABC transporter ATP-binding protein DppD n=2 Tax=Nocardioides gansuensis TaxID=2138300 RepID=A0A2T8FE95_9ACTN|nr:dipeptide ABC transporter ATP-binding protein DppD [Nocardioides gansuensis]
MPRHVAAPLLEIRDLRVEFPEIGGGPAIDGMDLTVGRGEIVALVGESGSGKSLTALTMMGLLPPGAEVSGGTALLDGEDVLAMAPKRLNEVRGNKVAMLFQQPKVMLDPTARVGGQVSEALRRHRKVGRREARARVVEMLRDVGIPEPARRASSFAYQLSGGMAQRVMIAAALSADPELVIADEPTTALDVTVQAQILDLLKTKRDTLGLSILLITHDLGIVSSMADRVAVMYAGRIVENGTTQEIFTNPQHPYTEALLKASLLEAERGQLYSIPGSVAQARAMQHGCRFLPRCPKAAELGITAQCSGAEPTLHICGDHDHHSRCHAAPEHAEAR